MESRRGFLKGLLVLPSALAAGGVCRPLGASESVRFAVIVAKDSSMSDLAFYELRRLYKGEAVNAAGRRLIPLNFPPNTDNRMRFDRALLGLSPEAVSRYWIDRKIRGQSGPPRAVDSSDLIRRVVTRLDGAIAYLRLGDVTSDVKVLRIDGKAPQDAGYPIAY